MRRLVSGELVAAVLRESSYGWDPLLQQGGNGRPALFFFTAAFGHVEARL